MNNNAQIEQSDSPILIKIINDVLSRGNDVEIKQSKNGIKILEISKKLRIEITKK